NILPDPTDPFGERAPRHLHRQETKPIGHENQLRRIAFGTERHVGANGNDVAQFRGDGKKPAERLEGGLNAPRQAARPGERGAVSAEAGNLLIPQVEIRSPAFNRVPSDSISARSRRPIWIRKMQRGSLVYSSTDPSRRNRASRAATANASQRDRDADVYAPSQPSALSRSSTRERSTFPAMVAALVFSSARSLALAAA